MKLALFITALLSIQFAHAQQWEWTRRVNGLANDYTSDVFVDDSSNVYITGRSKFAVTFEDPINPISPIWYGHTDAYAAKYDKNGNLIWANQGGSNEPDWGWGITAAPDGTTYYTGEFSGIAVFGQDTLVSNGDRDVFVSKLDANGNYVWTKSFGGTESDKGQDIEFDAGGNLYITGFIGSQLTIGGTTIGTNFVSNAYLIKLDTAGNYLNVKGAGPSFARAYHLKSDKNGHIYMCGELLYNNNIAGMSVTGPTTLGWRDAFIAKLDTNLTPLWIKTGAGSFFNVAESISISDNYVYMTGFFSGTANFSGTSIVSNGQGSSSSQYNATRDIFVAKYDFSGNLIWAKGIGGTGFDYGYGIDVTNDDHIYVGGKFSDTVMFDATQLVAQEAADMFFTRLDGDGNVVWVKQQGGSPTDDCFALAVDKAENVYAVGGYRANVNFDAISMPFTENTGYIGKITQRTYPTFAFSDSALCYGDTLTISASGITSPLSYQFLVDQTVNNTIINNSVQLTIDSTTLLTGQIVVSNNMYSDTLDFSQLITNSTITPFNLGNDTIFCDNTLLTVGNSQNNTHIWSDNSTADSLVISAAGTYWLTLSDSLGCSSTDSIVIDHYDTSPIQFTFGLDTAFCGNDALQLSGPIGNFDYLWSNADITDQITVETASTYWLQVTDMNGCQTSDTINIDVYTVAALAFNLGADTSLCDYNILELIGPTGNYSYMWNTNETGNQITAFNSGTYYLTIADSNNCQNSDTITVNYLDCLALEENAISPDLIYTNNQIIVHNLDNQPFQLDIYNLAGQHIFNTLASPSIDLNGNLAAGSYVAVLSAKTEIKTVLKFVIH